MASTKINYRAIAIQATITAVVFALVNRFMSSGKGLGAPERLMLNLSTERMAQFADPFTMANVNNHKFLNEQLAPINVSDPETYKNGNRTTIANCAFIATYCKDDKMRAKANEMIENYKKHAI